MSMRRFALMLFACAAALPLAAGADDRARVTALADRFVAEYEKRFPISYRLLGPADGAQRRHRHQLARGRRALAASS